MPSTADSVRRLAASGAVAVFGEVIGACQRPGLAPRSRIL
jgi:hypothetical protein